MALSPSFSTGGMPRISARSVGTSVSSTLKTKLPSLKIGSSAKGVTLKGVTIPKIGTVKGGGKLSAKTLSGTSVKAPKPLKTGSISSALKGIVSSVKSGMKSGSLRAPGGGLGMSSSIGAPAKTPSPAFFGSPNAGPGAIGLGM